MFYCFTDTPLGLAKISGDNKSITAVSVMDFQSDDEKTAFLQGHESTEIPEHLEDCKFQLKEYFEGYRKSFDLELNPVGTEFQKGVWNKLRNIPYGKTLSYLQLSKQLGDVKAIRAVANANGKNPLWIVVPCHRIIGSDGSLTGYAGGLHRKKWLLEHEAPYKQQSLF